MDSKPLSDQVVTKPFRYTEERMIKAIQAASGNKSAVARMLNCHRVTVTDYIRRSKRIERAYDAEVQGIIDEAEDRMGALMRQEDDLNVSFRASELILTTKGKDRGYFKKMQGGSVNANVINVLNQVFPEIGDSDMQEIDEQRLDEIIEAEIEDSQQ